MSDSQDQEAGENVPLICDFCGEPSDRVRRVALDGDYERLRTRHKPQYACPRCSDRKEQERIGLDHR